MQIHVDENPNCPPSEQFVFQELGERRLIRGIKISEGTNEIACDVVGVQKGGRFAGAHAVKIADSGEGSAFLIYGGEWGIRLRPESRRGEPWDFSNSHQWGEPFKIYGSADDILFEGE